MKELEQIFFRNNVVFRNWLKKYHDKSPGVWLIFYKKHIKKESLYYKEALDVALCYGWIDSTVKKLDEEKYIQKFTPRTNLKNWSDNNKKKVNELIENGIMTEAGLKKIDIYLKTGKVDWEIKEPEIKEKKKLIIPESILKQLSKNEPALKNFNHLTPSQKRYFVEWITSAKREETIKKRLKETIVMLKNNQKLGLK
jgi:uncharacterized protein YdeI (YjbR/CyaY-like superfamily)